MERHWRDRVVYQIYPRSFYDTNGDGIGDLPGITAKLDYLAVLGIGAIWLSPVYTSPNEDYGYDISDYRNINPEYGTMEDMERLIFEAEKRDILVIMDLVVNHTSDQHPWFNKSRRKIDPYTDYYIWQEGSGNKPPNNWTGFFGGSCWKFDEARGKWYLHLFGDGQPDLNYRNPAVLNEVKEIMAFWLKKGVAGFRCDVINLLWKSSLKNGKGLPVLRGREHYVSKEGVHKLLKVIREGIHKGHDYLSIGETVFVTPEEAKLFTAEARREIDMVFSFEHVETDYVFVKWIKKRFNPATFCKTLSKWQQELDWNANYLENHDQLRSVSRFGDDKAYWKESAKLLATLLLSLRGTPFIYQGQEIGMTNNSFSSIDEIRDPETFYIVDVLKKWHIPGFLYWPIIRKTTRDHSRTPLQWDDGTNGGFTSGRPWLRVNSNSERINIQSQLEDPDSILSYYRTLIRFRKSSLVMIRGDYKEIRIKGGLYVFERAWKDERLLVALNFRSKKVKADFRGEVVLSNIGRNSYDGSLGPYEAIILRRKDD